jgi:hypothetical protein
MAANSLTLNEMVHVTGMMTRDDARAALGRAPLLAPLLPVLDAAHERVLSAMPRSDSRLRDLSAAAAGVDAIHDALVSNLHGFLTALAGLSDEGTQYLALRDELLPDGVAGATQITYEAEAGYAERLRARLTPSLQERLTNIPVASRTLLDVVNDWLDAGDRLGRIEQERRQAELAAQPTTAVNNARIEWVRAINALRAVVPIAGLSDADRRTIFGLLQEIEAKAEQRSGRRRPRQLEQSVADELDADQPPPPEAVEDFAIDTSQARPDLPGGNPFTDS